MIAIIKYNAGNITSVQNAVRRLGYDSIVTNDPQALRAAEKVIFPGVGEASSAMNYLTERGLDQVIKSLEQPVLGICLGLQLMCLESEEGSTSCLGIFDTKVKRFNDAELVPHMGWNSIKNLRSSLFNALEEGDDTYFVHSYYAEISRDTSAICEYSVVFSAALEKQNFYATQFHPEKSAGIGEQILNNFLKL
ncbi:MAG: imidazole glycerol phosphate synthase subunit HisH [Crocinitomicaceae bacterium]|jgi:imidazole glycerol-phosphate synthase subunit HisH|nr:imidazole glycerol phosphate synthase subunit HisH [Crocinitomicaceae bacterium]MDG1658384.1 imidazole glycerol phosphate synthase subunit HisH [Crocinitomicaceae bacterium]|tara:strand:+ start:3294 stop:3872 length:579 start_codon:yes stop_codon:yes gene_type:complete